MEYALTCFIADREIKNCCSGSADFELELIADHSF